MPIFEYRCRGCGDQFEMLILPHSKQEATCPSCNGQDLEQLISFFSVSTAESRKTSMQAARKKKEKVIKDQQIADHEARLHHN